MRKGLKKEMKRKKEREGGKREMETGK